MKLSKPRKRNDTLIKSIYYQKNMTISLSIPERIQLVGVFNQVKGDIETLQAILEDVKEVSISAKEKEEISFEEIKDEGGQTTSFTWKNDVAKPKEITLSDKTVAFVKKFVDEKSKAQELSLNDAPLLEINKKLQ